MEIGMLQKDVLNILSIDTGKVDEIKSEEFCKKYQEQLDKKYPEYDIFVISKKVEIGMLQKDELNVLNLRVGRMPIAKAEEYIKKVVIKIKEEFGEYKIVYLGER